MPIENEFADYPPVIQDSPAPSDRVSVSATHLPFDANNPPWGLGAALLAWVLSIVLQLVFQVVLLVAYLVYAGWNPSDPDASRTFQTLTLDKTSIFLQVFALFPAHILTFVMVWALVTRIGKYPFLKMIGWEWPSRAWPWLSVVLGILLFGAGVALAKLVGAEKPTYLEQIINSSVATRYTIAFLAVFTAPVVEEFIYRGVLFAALQRLTGVFIAGVATLGLFTLIHVPQYWPNVGVLAAVGFLSVALTVIRAKTGRLLPCVVIHFIFNGVQSAILLIEPYVSNPVPVPVPVPDPVPSLFFLLQLGLF